MHFPARRILNSEIVRQIILSDIHWSVHFQDILLHELDLIGWQIRLREGTEAAAPRNLNKQSSSSKKGVLAPAEAESASDVNERDSTADLAADLPEGG